MSELSEQALQEFDTCLTHVLAAKTAARKARKYAQDVEALAIEAEEIAEKFDKRLLLFQDDSL